MADLEKLVARLESVTERLESVAAKGLSGGSGSKGSVDVDTSAVEGYDEFLKSSVDPFIALSEKFGGTIAEQAKLFRNAFTKQREFINMVAHYSTPAQSDLPAILKPTSDAMTDVTNFREKNRADKFFNHLSSLSESIGALGWVTVAPKPKLFCKEMADAGQFYINRVIKDYKEKDQQHVEWARSLQRIFPALINYIDNYHQTGCKWNPSGKKATGAAPAAAPAPSAGGPPPPPPPGPPPPPEDLPAAPAGQDDSAARNALFDAINKGSDITSGLKKVNKDQMTHKNPAIRNTGPVPYKAPTHKPISAPRPFGTTSTPKKPPKLALEGKKWIIEYQDGNQNIILDRVNLNQTVYVFRCDKSVIQVKGKVNSITLDGCKKTAVVFEDLVSMVEFINCQSVQAQANGAVPTISIDKTDGCQLYLKEASLNADIVSAKSSEMNVAIVKPDGDLSEYPIPEQFKTKWTGKGLTTTVNDIAG